MSELLQGTSLTHVKHRYCYFLCVQCLKAHLVKTLIHSVPTSETVSRLSTIVEGQQRACMGNLSSQEFKDFHIKSFSSIDFKRRIPFLSDISPLVSCAFPLPQDQSQWSWIICYSIVRILHDAALFLARCEFHVEIVHQGCCDNSKYHQCQVLTHATVRSCIRKHQA